MKKVRLMIEGMHCAGCTARVEQRLGELGCREIGINLSSGAAMMLVPDEVSPRELCGAIEELGFKARTQDAPAAPKKDGMAADLIMSAILTAPMVIGMILSLFLPHDSAVTALLHNKWLQLILATPVQFIAGRRFYTGAFKALRARYANMDVLVALGTSSAYFLSVYNLIAGRVHGMEGLYFEASAVIITLVLLGKLLESRATGKTGAAVAQLLALAPQTAHVERDGQVTDVPAGSVAKGDILLVLQGERFPVDGTITSGVTTADEAMLTGESMPVEKSCGDEAAGGTVNLGGVVRMRADRVGDDTSLARIVRMVEQAQTSKAPIARLADKISGIFVPAVLVIALLTFIGWLTIGGAGVEESIVRAVAAVVVACPCSLGLATPTAVMVGVGSGALGGILFKDGSLLERAAAVDAVVLDKTGTVTCGKASVTDIIPQGISEKSLIELAAAVERLSAHPIASAICARADELCARSLPCDDFTAQGRSVCGVVGGARVTVSAPEQSSGEIARLESQGKTVVTVDVDGEHRGIIAVADSIRPDAGAAVSALHNMGVTVIMVTGDNRRAAAYISAQAGIEEFRAGVRVEEKPGEVELLRKGGKVVAMVGDGINDAPALTAADVGMAIGDGSAIAVESAGITLLRPGLTSVPAALRLARATMRKIKQNLFWAFIYNAVCIPLAVFGVFTPIMAGAAMALSSVSVVSNSLLLRRYKFNVFK